MSDREEDVARDFQAAVTVTDRLMADITQYEYDVFIVFATEDEDLARNVCDKLENLSPPLRCIAQFKDGAFRIGQNVVDNIVHNVKKSKTTLLLLTDKSLNNNWVTLETVLALEESNRSGQLRLRMLVHNLSSSELQKFQKMGLLASVPYIRLDVNRDDWDKTLAQEIRRDRPLPELLPVGSMAHGLVFSHYTGFLCQVLPKLKKMIEEDELYKQKKGKVSTKYFMLLPGSCRIHGDLSGRDDEMGVTVCFEKTIQFEVKHAGKLRRYKLTIYKIMKDAEEYFFFADFPNVLNSMFTMENKKLAKVDMRHQIARFYYTMNEMINHAENKHCHDTVHLILFNEDVESVQRVLWQAVSEDIRRSQRMGPEAQSDISPMPIENLAGSSTAESMLDATVTCDEDSDADKVIATTVVDFLKSSGKNVEVNQARSQLKVENAKWHIFVLSKAALSSVSCLSVQCCGALIDSMDDKDGLIRVLVVIKDIEPRLVPRFIRCVNMLKADEPHFEKKILECMEGDALRLEHKLPCGDVATGLAWAYVINYLHIPLLGLTAEEKLDLSGRIKRCLQENKISHGCIVKLFVVLPESCRCEGKFPVKQVGRLLPVKKSTGGQTDREFFLYMYKHTDNETHRTVCFLMEYCTPAYCMRTMVDEHKFAGLSEEEMGNQCEDFVKILTDIINREAVKNELGDISKLVEVIKFDDQQEDMLSAIERHVQAKGHEMVFAEDK